jgi:hypothetical protein
MNKKKHPFLVAVPKTDEGAYNHGRFISSLIEHQIKHLHEVEKALPRQQQTNTDIAGIKTELEASEYIRKVTAKLHPEGARSPRTGRKTAEPGKRVAATRTRKNKKKNLSKQKRK